GADPRGVGGTGDPATRRTPDAAERRCPAARADTARWLARGRTPRCSGAPSQLPGAPRNWYPRSWAPPVGGRVHPQHCRRFGMRPSLLTVFVAGLVVWLFPGHLRADGGRAPDPKDITEVIVERKSGPAPPAKDNVHIRREDQPAVFHRLATVLV